jgi:hypothetical protein
MYVDVSFSCLRSAATASFDIKEFHRNCTAPYLYPLQRIYKNASEKHWTLWGKGSFIAKYFQIIFIMFAEPL